jgi:polyisoprenoid-binding protein YceI
MFVHLIYIDLLLLLNQTKLNSMKKNLMAIAVFAIFIGICSFVPGNKKADPIIYKVATESSKIEWVGSKKGGYHNGSFLLKSGTVTVDNGKITGGQFVIDLGSVKADAGEKLESHLKSPDFFDVAKFAEATYEITSVNYTAPTVAEIAGNLTLKGATVVVKFNANIRNLDDKKFFGQANFSIDRTTWGLNYGPGMVSNDVQVGVYLFANK